MPCAFYPRLIVCYGGYAVARGGISKRYHVAVKCAGCGRTVYAHKLLYDGRDVLCGTCEWNARLAAFDSAVTAQNGLIVADRVATSTTTATQRGSAAAVDPA